MLTFCQLNFGSWWNVLSIGSEVLLSKTVASHGEIKPLERITSFTSLSDGNLHTCEDFEGYNDTFLYIWVYTGDLIGPLHIHVVGNHACWPETALRVMIISSDSHIEHCSPRTENIVPADNYRVCPHYCRCRNCGVYIAVQIPVDSGTIQLGRKICEIYLG